MKYYITCLALILCTSNYISGQLYINEVIPSNDNIIADNFGEYDDLIEIYNAGNAPLNLAGYYLSDDSGSPLMWQIPTTDAALTTVPASGYVIFWADNETTQGANHLNFKLSSSGENVILTAPDGVTTVDNLSFSAVAGDEGFGRLPDGGATLSQIIPATPATTNDNSQPKADVPVFSISGGPYSSTQSVSISTPMSGSTIRYTIDGSEPTSSSLIYSSILTVDSVTVLRARTFKIGYAESDVASATYLIGVSHNLPIICINSNPDNFWDDSIGIYVEGTNGITSFCSTTPKNFWQDWERPVNVQMYESDGTPAFNIDAGISISGGCSRNRTIKSFNIATRKIYPTEQINYQLFPDRDQHEFRRFKLRNAGRDMDQANIRDGLAQTIAKDLDVETQGFRPSVVYINGEYWGVMNIRDVFSEHYLKYKYPKLDKDSIDLMFMRFFQPSGTPNIRVTEGDTIAFTELYNFVRDNDMSDPANYEYVNTLMDISQYTTYNIAQIAIGNTDWPANNNRVWRDKREGGKFRWILFDTDFSLGRYNNPSNTKFGNPYDHNTLAHALYEGWSGWPRDSSSTMMLRKLLENPEFTDEFIQRFATQLNIVFDTSRTTALVDHYKTMLDGEMNAHINKWELNSGSHQSWRDTVDFVRTWLAERPPYIREHVRNHFGVSGTYNLTLNFDQNSNGVAVVNSNDFAVPFNYTGEYYSGVPLKLRAIPDPGYRFAYWQETGNTSSSIIVNYSSAQTLTPVFEPALDVVINEIHYHPDDSINEKEFIEIYNPDTKARDLSGYEFSEGICFNFPAGTSINPGEYIIIAADATQYAGNGYQVFEWEQSKLNNDGEDLHLVNSRGNQIDTLRYNDGMPWALLADGFGASLELNYPIPADNIAATDWQASTPNGGTPGAQNSTPCIAPQAEIIINEINYNSNNTTNPGDWVELYNPNSTSIDISNWQFFDSENTFTIPTGTMLEPDDYLVLAEDGVAFGSIFPHLNNGANYIGDLLFNLSNGGERVSLFDQNKCLVDELVFNDKIPWDTIPDGNGPTLSLITPNSDNVLAQSWEASSNINSAYGTPGRMNAPCLEQQIMIPDTIYANIDTLLTIDIPNDDVVYNWFISGATSTNNNADSTLVNFANPGTYNIQLISNYFECTKVAFKQIVVIPGCVDIQLQAYLEGAYDPTLSEMRTTLVATRKLLPGQTPTSNLATPTPAGQPYNIAPWNYNGTEGAGWTDADYTGDETDWVLVSFRTDIQKNTEVAMTAGLLMKDGSIDFPDRCALGAAVADSLYIAIEHRNHIGIMTHAKVPIINNQLSFDFRTSDSYRDPTSFGQKLLPTGEWTMFAGDADQSDFPSFDIKGTDKTVWFDNNGIFDYYFSPDFNLDGDINGQDKSLWFDNNGISSRVPK